MATSRSQRVRWVNAMRPSSVGVGPIRRAAAAGAALGRAADPRRRTPGRARWTARSPRWGTVATRSIRARRPGGDRLQLARSRTIPGEAGPCRPAAHAVPVRTGAVRTFPWPVAGPPFSAEPELRMHDGNAHLPRPLLAALALVMAATPLAGQEAARHAGSAPAHPAQPPARTVYIGGSVILAAIPGPFAWS